MHNEIKEKIYQNAVDFFGVKLPRAQVTSGILVPQIPANFAEDEFVMGLERDVAVDFLLGDPVMMEGGTSIGKTTLILYMAAKLGWEVHYANLNGRTDPNDLIGNWLPNAKRTSANEAEHVFIDEAVASGLRIERGKIKIILLDEFNAAKPNVVIRLHEILDRLKRNSRVVLKEKSGDEIVETDNARTKIVALSNPPGKGYLAKEPIDPAQIRRWVYHKLPTNLPEGTFRHSSSALFGLCSFEKPGAREKVKRYESLDRPLTIQQMSEIPGIREIHSLYTEFHQTAKRIVAKLEVASDQPQKFTFDDREEPLRVSAFIRHFYKGDITETMQTALRLYYLNKLESDSDRLSFEETIKHIAYEPKSAAFSQRKAISVERTNNGKGGFTQEQKLKLERLGYTIYTLPGKTMKELEMGTITINRDESENVRCIKGEVAVPSLSKFPLAQTRNMSFDEQIRGLELFMGRQDIRKVKVIIGNHADYIALLSQQVMNKNRGYEDSLAEFLKDHELYLRTGTTISNKNGERVLVQFQGQKNFKTIPYRETGHDRIAAFPLIVPES